MIKPFVIREDSMPLYEGSANGLRKHESGVPAQVAAMAPQIQQLVSQKQFQRNMERLVDKMDDGKMNHSTGYCDLALWTSQPRLRTLSSRSGSTTPTGRPSPPTPPAPPSTAPSPAPEIA
ncbi:MAG: hypothetical protein ACLUNZ_01175 [Evtepia sp.]